MFAEARPECLICNIMACLEHVCDVRVRARSCFVSADRALLSRCAVDSKLELGSLGVVGIHLVVLMSNIAAIPT